MDSLVFFLQLLLIPSAIGAVSYFLCRRIKPTSTQFLLALAAFLILIVLLSGTIVIGIVLLAVASLLSKVGTWAHLKSVHFHKSDWSSPYQLVLTATVISFICGSLLEIIFREFALFRFWLNLKGFFINIPLYYVLLLTSPALTPFLIWAWQSLTLRPGMDKHLES